jgi:hypothetical protein
MQHILDLIVTIALLAVIFSVTYSYCSMYRLHIVSDQTLPHL